MHQPEPNTAPPANAGSPGRTRPLPPIVRKAGPNRSAISSGTGNGHLSFFGDQTSASAQARGSASGRAAHRVVTSSARGEGRRTCRLKPRQLSPYFDRKRCSSHAEPKSSASSLTCVGENPGFRDETFCRPKTPFRRAQDHRRLPSAKPRHAKRVRPRCGPSAGRRQRRI
jgi:hypothetical protein